MTDKDLHTTTIRIKKKLYKQIQYLIIEKETTGVTSLSSAINWGLHLIVKAGGIRKGGE